MTTRSAPAIALVLLVSACADDASSPPRCAPDGPGRQPVDRFPTGSTFDLPPIDPDAPGCADARWELVSAPDGNRNAVVAAAPDRFSPHVLGEHVFRIEASDEELRLTAIDGLTVPFHHLHYYPGTSIAMVDGSPWTADVYRPTVTPLGGAPVRVGAWPVAIAWRPGMTHAVVAQRASDDLGLVDIAAGRLVDAIPVGDEPAEVVLSPDGAIAYVALAVSGDVAVVDLTARAVTRRIPLAPDVRALALSPDGATLYAARLRSGQPERDPFPDTPVEAERDVFVVDTATGAIERELIDVGATIRHLAVSPDGAVLYATRLTNLTSGNLADGAAHFVDEVVRFDAATGDELAAADLGRQPGSGGWAVTLQGLALAGDTLWTVAEGSDVAVALDAATLEELRRVPAPGRPRAIVADGDAVHVHGPQGFVVTTIAEEVTETSTGADPRPGAVARGQRLFTGAGAGYGAGHGCISCHAEGTTDTLVWKVGPIDEYAVPRPLFWLEGTARLGWPGYLSSVRNWGYEGGSTTGTRPTTEEAEDLAAFLAALMPPPPGNDFTRPDGELSDEALRGKEIFEGTGGCVLCHRAPLFTTGRLLDDGVTPGLTDVPSLVGAYRHGVWLKDGSAETLRDAVARVSTWLDAGLDDGQLDDLTRYLQELTARDFFVLASDPAADATDVAIDRPIMVTMSLPVWDDPANLARVRLLDEDGAPVPAAIAVDGRHLAITPDARLAHGRVYRIELGAELESFDQRAAPAAVIGFATAAAPALAVDGDYRWTLDMPVFDPVGGGFDPERTTPLELPMSAEATASGAELTFDLGLGLTYTRHAVVAGERLHLPAMPLPVGPTLADVALEPGALSDDDGDGRADGIAGVLTLTGPGFVLEGLTWTATPALRPDLRLE